MSKELHLAVWRECPHCEGKRYEPGFVSLEEPCVPCRGIGFIPDFIPLGNLVVRRDPGVVSNNGPLHDLVQVIADAIVMRDVVPDMMEEMFPDDATEKTKESKC